MAEKFDDIRRMVLNFRDEHDWARYHDPKNLAEAISIESSELLENFLWKTVAESRQLEEKELENIREEIADIIIYLMYLCEELNIDMLDEIIDKIRKNELRFPKQTQEQQ